ncbi:hypothetical protein D915_005950 [Fasciola hepatica]|uniref:Uncharacterized protein n=1 Tax=Fasciola hepatica TaxID=6192 RepID=A0A4E0R887_FASHE|nr:hypothetical protein D915_005950 [Fasciola hepatica]
MAIVNELSAYTNPPSIIVKLVDTSLSLTEVEKTQHERTGQWSDYRRMINKRWQNQVLLFDPTNARAAINLRNLDQLFSDDIQNEVDQCQSKAAKILYQWMRCCRTVSHIQSSMDKE